MVSPRRLIVITTACALLAGVGGFVAASFVLSPAESAARTAPPPAGPISAPVSRTVLHSQVVTRGDVNYSDPVQVTVPGGTGNPVLTGRVPEAGAAVTEGMVLAEVSGRPVIVLDGSLPSYRTLTPGSTGPDVVQLQQALARLGYSPGEADGQYDGELAAAVAALYAAVGYPAPTASPEETAALEAARERESAAEQQRDEMAAALEEAGEGPSRSAQLAAEAAVTAAANSLAQAKASNPVDTAAVQSARGPAGNCRGTTRRGAGGPGHVAPTGGCRCGSRGARRGPKRAGGGRSRGGDTVAEWGNRVSDQPAEEGG